MRLNEYGSIQKTNTKEKKIMKMNELERIQRER